MLRENCSMLTIIVISTLLLGIESAIRQGSIKEHFMNHKYNCAGKSVVTAASQMQCVHRCLRKDECEVMNYRERKDESPIRDNCEVFDVPSNDESCTSTQKVGWKGLLLTRKTEPKSKVYKSCKEIKQNLPAASSGVYELKDGKHFCRMADIPECGTGGWTLAVKINGQKDTFYADKEIWVNSATVNVANGIKSFYSEEAKFNAFSKLSFDSVCIGMKFEGTAKWLFINQSGSSLQDIFKAGTYIATAISRATWKGLIDGSSLQLYCNRQGFNVKDHSGTIIVRIGFIGNEFNNCVGPDSFIGLGSTNVIPDYTYLPKISCGNIASWEPDNGNKSLATMGFILVH